MGSHFARPSRRAAAWAVAALVLAGCSQSGGPSDYDKMVAAKKGAADSLATSGAKVVEKQYPPLGSGWTVDEFAVL